MRLSLCLPAVLALACFGMAADAGAQSVSVEAFAGSAYNLPTPLTVQQDGYPDVRITARYDTKPFGPYAPYYSWRVSLWNADRTAAWEIGQLHHRLFLTNNPPEIDEFEIHYGYNFFFVGRAWTGAGFVYHVDGGVLICNPANTVRGQELDTRGTGLFGAGYSVSGGGAALAVSREIDLAGNLFVSANGGLLLGRARVPVVDGSAAVPNVSLHGQIGLGLRF